MSRLLDSGRWWFDNIIRVAIALFFVVAGVSKLFSPRRFVELIGDYGIVYDSLVEPAAWSLIFLEIAAGVALLFNIAGGLALISTLLIMFIGVLIYGIQLGLDIDCGCFGIESGSILGGDMWTALWRDIVMLALCGYLVVGELMSHGKNREINK